MCTFLAPCAAGEADWIAEYPMREDQCRRGQWEARAPRACKRRAELILGECSRYVRLVAALSETPVEEVYVRGSTPFKTLMDAEEAKRFPFLHAVQLALDHDTLQRFFHDTFPAFWPERVGLPGPRGAPVCKTSFGNVAPPTRRRCIGSEAAAGQGCGSVSLGTTGWNGDGGHQRADLTGTGRNTDDDVDRISSGTTIPPPGEIESPPSHRASDTDVAAVNWKKVQGYAIVRQMADLDDRQKRDLDGKIHSLLMRWIG